VPTLIYLVHTIPKNGGFCTTEFSYLSKYFSRIIIISNVLGYDQIKELPATCKLYPFPPTLTFTEKIISNFQLAYSAFWNEYFWLRAVKKIPFSKGLIFTLTQSLFLSKKLANFIVSKCPEIREGKGIVVYSFWMNHMALSTALLKTQFPDIKAICRAHGSDLYFEVQAIRFLPFTKIIAEKMDRIYFISGKGKKYFENLIGKQSINWQLAYLGSLPPINQIVVNENSEKILLTCSLVTPGKRLDLFVEALNLINDKIKWVHIGDGPQLEALKSLASRLPSNINTHFTGYMDQNMVVDFMRSLRPVALINVSVSEGLPVSMMEAMSASIPVIATNVGGVDEIVQDTVNGLLLQANPDAKDIVKTLGYFLELTVEQRLLYRTAAFQRWSQFFNGDVNYNNFAYGLKIFSEKD
jgi:glycosyltransferase involved in cell wall biosynthesis